VGSKQIIIYFGHIHIKPTGQSIAANENARKAPWPDDASSD